MKNKKYIQFYLAGLVTVLGVGGVFANSATVKTYLENLRNTESGQVGYILGEIFYGSGSLKEGKIKQEYLDLEGLSGGSSSSGGGAVSSVNTRTGDVTLTKSDVGLGNVDNTSDVNKPVSTATQTALNLKANLASPALTGTPTAPTAAVSTNNTQIATTAFVKSQGYITSSNSVTSVNTKTGTVVLTKTDISLGNVDNTSDATKNVLSATKLTTARNIAGVSFDGTINIDIPFANLISKPTTLAGYGITDAQGLIATGTTAQYYRGDKTWVTLNSASITDATNLNTANMLVKRDASGNFSAGTITANLTGNSTTATSLQNSRTINGVSFNGTANITLPTVNLSGDQIIGGIKTFTGNIVGVTPIANDHLATKAYVDSIVGSSQTTYEPKFSTGTTAQYYRGDKTWATLNSASITDATNLNTANMLVKRDASGNFSAGTITATLSGNALTATRLQTPRTIAGVSFNGTADIAIPFANLTTKPTTLAGYGITDAVTLGTSQTITGPKYFSNMVVGTGISSFTGNSIQLSTDNTFGGVHNQHTGIRMFSYDMNGWGTAKLGFQVSNEWGSYFGGNTPAKSDLAMVIGQNETLIKGNVGIGVISPQAKLEVAGNVVADTPIASNHLATKAYVDTVAVASASSASSNNLQAAGTFFNTGGNPFYCQQTSVVASPGYKYAQVANIGKICDQSDVNNIKLCSLQGACSDGATTLKIMDGTGTLSVSDTHACAVRQDGKIMCWGQNSSGQLGDGTTIARNYAVLVAGADNNNFIGVSVGNNFTCGVKNDGKVWCWGLNGYRQLGDGTITTRTSPVLVSGTDNTGFIQVSAGYQHVCGLKNDGKIWCWGRGDFGSIGTGGGASTYPLTIVSSNTVANSSYVDVSVGTYHSCGIKSTGALICWGYNGNGQIGLDPAVDQISYFPYQKMPSGYKKIYAFGQSTCAITTSGQITCMGSIISSNAYNYVNIGGALNTGFEDMISQNDTIVCGIRSDGGVYCNTTNTQTPNGVTTFGTTTHSYTLYSAKKLSKGKSGAGFSCFQNRDDTVSCFGQGSYLGDNSGLLRSFNSYVITPN